MSTISQGHCDARFAEVRAEFERNFAERGEVGAAVCVLVEGQAVVDLWGGLANPRTGQAWQRDTLTLVWSCTKGAVALCAHVLNSRGLLDLDAPLTRYWPEFGQQGKESITLRLVLAHQAGLPALRAPLRPGGLYDWAYMTEMLAAEPLFWEPGTRQGYHAATFGHLVGEIIQRVSGQSLADFFRTEIAGPLNLDFHLGLAESEEGRVAPTIRPAPVPRGQTPWRFLTQALAEPTSVQGLIVRNTGRHSLTDIDSRAAHAAVLPSQGGLTHARGLARLYHPLALGGMWNSVRLVDPDTLAALGAVHSASLLDAVLLVGLRFGLGFLKSADNRQGPPGATDSLLLSETAFGHPGMGGSLGFADPGCRMSFGYALNKQGWGVLLNERGQALVDAVYRVLGYRSNQSGRWV